MRFRNKLVPAQEVGACLPTSFLGFWGGFIAVGCFSLRSHLSSLLPKPLCRMSVIVKETFHRPAPPALSYAELLPACFFVFRIVVGGEGGSI